jgi:hypothetical protein
VVDAVLERVEGPPDDFASNLGSFKELILTGRVLDLLEEIHL